MTPLGQTGKLEGKNQDLKHEGKQKTHFPQGFGFCFRVQLKIILD